MQTDPVLSDFWGLETISIKDKVDTNNEVAMKKFRETLKLENDRYLMTWP